MDTLARLKNWFLLSWIDPRILLKSWHKVFNWTTDFIREYEHLMDEVFVLSRIIKVEVGVVNWSWRLRLITLAETLIILDITKTESDNCFITHWTKNNMDVMSLLLGHFRAIDTKCSNLTRLHVPWHDIYVIHRLWSVRIGKNCALCLKYGPRPQAEGCTQDRGHSFSQYGPTNAGE